jgi:hypothetical protein
LHGSQQYLNDAWQYDASTDTWTAINNFGGSKRAFAVSFVCNNEAYVGTGYDSSNNYKADFFKYDPIAGQWTSIAPLAGNIRWGATAFAIQGSGYVCSGFYNNTFYNDLWEYDVQNDNWISRTALSGPTRSHSSAFVINGYAYLFGGANTVFLNDGWKYEPANSSVGVNEITNSLLTVPQVLERGKELSLSDYGNCKLTVFDATGNMICRDKNQFTFNESAGIYLLSIRDDKKVIYTGKLLVY